MPAFNFSLVRKAAQGPIQCDGAILKTPMEVHKDTGRIVVIQKTRLWFRMAVWFGVLIVALHPFMIYSEIFTVQTSHFTCDRESGACSLNGRTEEIPRLAEITRAQINRAFNRRDGTNWGIDLITRDGRKHSIEVQRAIKDSTIADYRAAVKAINAYLANPSEKNLDATFTYVAGLSEILMSCFYLVFFSVVLFFALLQWNKRVYTFEPGKITLESSGLLQRDSQEIGAGRIAAVVRRVAAKGAFVELKLVDDGGSTLLLFAGNASDSSKTVPLAAELAGFLGRPLELHNSN